MPTLRQVFVAGRPVTVVIECDTGQKRAGVATPNEAVALAKIVKHNLGFEFGGLMFYPPSPMAGQRHRSF